MSSVSILLVSLVRLECSSFKVWSLCVSKVSFDVVTSDQKVRMRLINRGVQFKYQRRFDWARLE